MIATHTRTHGYTVFANPYLACDECGGWVTGWHDPAQCGCDDGSWNMPCGCDHAGVTSVCPSWSPVDGCRCAEHLGGVGHGTPAGRVV